MAKRPAHRGSRCRGMSKCEGTRCCVQSCGHRRRRSAASPKVSNDRRSNERGSARSERRTPRRDEGNRGAIGMLDRLRGERHRQLRRLRNKGVRGEIDGGADRAIVVNPIAGLLPRKRLRSLRAGESVTTGDKRTRRRRDGRARTTRRSAAPAQRTPAKRQTGCWNGPNASGLVTPIRDFAASLRQMRVLNNADRRHRIAVRGSERSTVRSATTMVRSRSERRRNRQPDGQRLDRVQRHSPSRRSGRPPPARSAVRLTESTWQTGCRFDERAICIGGLVAARVQQIEAVELDAPAVGEPVTDLAVENAQRRDWNVPSSVSGRGPR